MDIVLLQTIREQTVPVVRESEPAAMRDRWAQDCWDEIFEQLVADTKHEGELEMKLEVANSEVTHLREANTLKDQEIAAYQDRIETLQAFVQKFLDNFEDCDNCGGRGVDTRLHDMCRPCHGEGKQIVSKGILYNELRTEAEDLVVKS